MVRITREDQCQVPRTESDMGAAPWTENSDLMTMNVLVAMGALWLFLFKPVTLSMVRVCWIP